MNKQKKQLTVIFNEINDFSSLVDDFMDQGYDRKDAEGAASNVLYHDDLS